MSGDSSVIRALKSVNLGEETKGDNKAEGEGE